jgi:hypothetical protein
MRGRAGPGRRLQVLVVGGLGPQCTLLVFIDDATVGKCTRSLSRGVAFAYLWATRAYLEVWGKRVAFYSDKHAVSRVNNLCHPSQQDLVTVTFLNGGRSGICISWTHLLRCRTSNLVKGTAAR